MITHRKTPDAKPKRTELIELAEELLARDKKDKDKLARAQVKLREYELEALRSGTENDESARRNAWRQYHKSYHRVLSGLQNVSKDELLAARVRVATAPKPRLELPLLLG